MSNYTDGIRVKISERYKPPHKINLIMPYAQRLTINKQLEENLPNYEFLLEKTVVDKMREWRTVRSTMLEKRIARLDKAKEELKDKEEETAIAQERVGNLDQTVSSTNTQQANSTNLFTSAAASNQSYSRNNILMPTQATSGTYSNILTPIPLPTNQKYSCKPVDKSPFNISDFENDTSSPFDNMELKTINDMEELAQVLKTDETTYKNTLYNSYQPSAAVGSSTVQQQPRQTNYNHFGSSQYTSYIPNTLPYGNQSVDYSQQPQHATTNGYYYPSRPNVVQPNSTFQASSYGYDRTRVDYSYAKASDNPTVQETKNNSRSVPDIIKALQAELDNTKIVDNSATPTSTHFPPQQAKSTDGVYPKAKTKVEDLEDPLSLLPKNLQDLCRSISSMGFPLSRVARTCKAIGNDHKKIVEHLLAMSYLLDLGFSERDISNALLQCDNDKEKALDKLIQ